MTEDNELKALRLMIEALDLVDKRRRRNVLTFLFERVHTEEVLEGLEKQQGIAAKMQQEKKWIGL